MWGNIYPLCTAAEKRISAAESKPFKFILAIHFNKFNYSFVVKIKSNASFKTCRHFRNNIKCDNLVQDNFFRSMFYNRVVHKGIGVFINRFALTTVFRFHRFYELIRTYFLFLLDFWFYKIAYKICVETIFYRKDFILDFMRLKMRFRLKSTVYYTKCAIQLLLY